jgi:hypothetical protein
MIFEINLLAGKMLILHHKLIEVIKISPRYIVEHHHYDFNDKIRSKWGDSIFRTVVPTSDFALPSEENIGETHKKLAKTRRGAKLINQNEMLKVINTHNNFNRLKIKDFLVKQQFTP